MNISKKDTLWSLAAGLLIIAGGLMIVYFVIWSTGALMWSFDIALVFILLSGICMTYIGMMLIKKKKILFFISNRYLKTTIVLLTASFIISFTVIEGMIFSCAIKDDSDVSADFVLIPGAEVVKDIPSRVLLHRLQKALPYIKKNSGAFIIVSGSIGQGDTLSEAEVMEKYLVENGVDRNRIIKENKALNSYQNVNYARNIIENTSRKDSPKLMIITNGYHVFRMKTIAYKAGIKVFGVPVSIHYSVAPICYVREYFSVLKNFLYK